MFPSLTVEITGFLGYENGPAMMYSAVIAVVLVHVVLGFWIFAACSDDKPKKLEKHD